MLPSHTGPRFVREREPSQHEARLSVSLLFLLRQMSRSNIEYAVVTRFVHRLPTSRPFCLRNSDRCAAHVTSFPVPVYRKQTSGNPCEKFMLTMLARRRKAASKKRIARELLRAIVLTCFRRKQRVYPIPTFVHTVMWLCGISVNQSREKHRSESWCNVQHHHE